MEELKKLRELLENSSHRITNCLLLYSDVGCFSVFLFERGEKSTIVHRFSFNNSDRDVILFILDAYDITLYLRLRFYIPPENYNDPEYMGQLHEQLKTAVALKRKPFPPPSGPSSTYSTF